ncbi:hypothetical protein NW759_011505 [Fusarium solani]|nr:hypothetical protein NW759_011505 [Fusarium solani]
MALMRTWEFEPFAAILLQCAQRYALSGELSIEAFWRTLIFDTETHSAHPASPELGSAFGCWVLQTIFYYVEHSDLPGYGCEATIRSMKNYKALADRDAHVAGDMLPDFDRKGSRWSIYRMKKIARSNGWAIPSVL